MVSLTGTGRLADDVYLLAHHEVSGRPFLHARVLGLGLAGALLAELVLEGKIFIRPGEVVVADRPPNARQYFGEAVRQLGPDLRDLIAQTQAAVDSAVLAHRL